MAKQLKNSIQELLDKKYSDSWQINILKNMDSIFGNLRSKVQIEKIYDDCVKKVSVVEEETYHTACAETYGRHGTTASWDRPLQHCSVDGT